MYREEHTSIRVYENGDWYAGSRKIWNKKVLGYFKKNLHIDSKGIYIFNTFGKFQERGYIQVNGPILKIKDIDTINKKFILENGEDILFCNVKICMNKKEQFFVYHSRLQGWCFFDKSLFSILIELIQYKNNKVYFIDYSIQQKDNIEWVVKL